MTPMLTGLLIATLVQPMERPWLGADYWANPAEDWVRRGDQMVNTHSGGDRNVVLLTKELNGLAAVEGTATFAVEAGQVPADGFVGFEVGKRGEFDDYRDDAIYGRGLMVGLTGDGNLFVGNRETFKAPVAHLDWSDIQLVFKTYVFGDQPKVNIEVVSKGQATQIEADLEPSWLDGSVAVVVSAHPEVGHDSVAERPETMRAPNQGRRGDFRVGITDVSLTGEGVVDQPARKFGPVLWTTYTLEDSGRLNLLVQGAIYGREERPAATLRLGEREARGEWEPISRTAKFVVAGVNPVEPIPYTVTLDDGTYHGVIRPRPQEQGTIASLSCNDADGFPHNLLVENVLDHDPDLVTFHGDQIYERVGGYGLIYDQKPNDRAVQSYLRKYMMHGWTWRDLLADRPSVTIPDDHDVYHGNIWGAGGKLADVSGGWGYLAQDSGGYKMSPEFVNAVHRTQTGNLPDPVDPAPADNGISVYFTRLQYGPFDVAVLADRQFKSAPKALLPEAEIQNGWRGKRDYDAAGKADVPGAQLLGARQEKFLGEWASQRGKPFRVVVSQAPWLSPQTLPKDALNDEVVPNLPVYKPGEYAPDDIPNADFDTNGWPQTPRRLAVAMMRKAGAIHLVGDQHLGTTGQYGIDTFDDGSWWVTTPAIANIWPRRWMPMTPAERPMGRFLGGYHDAFGNPFTLHAVANPVDVDREPARLYDRAVGYTITRWQDGRVTFVNWPYWASPKRPAPDNEPYEGWPITVDLQTMKRLTP